MHLYKFCGKIKWSWILILDTIYLKMKNIAIKIFILLSSLGLFSYVHAWLFTWWDNNDKVIYCDWTDWTTCDLETGKNIVVNNVNNIKKDMTFFEYVQKMLIYIIWFVALLWVIYIIYAWFMHLTSAWDEEKAGNTKKIIISVFIWILIIWLSYAIVSFFMNILAAWTRQVNP